MIQLKNAILKELRARKSQLSEDIEILTKQTNELKGKKIELVKEIKVIKSRIHKEKEELKSLRETIKEKQTKITNLERRIRNQESDIKGYEEYIEKIKLPAISIETDEQISKNNGGKLVKDSKKGEYTISYDY